MAKSTHMEMGTTLGGSSLDMIEIERRAETMEGGFNTSKTRNEDGKTVKFALGTKNGNSGNSQSACSNKPSSKAHPGCKSPDPKLTKYLNMDEEELKSRLLEKKPELSVEDLMGVSTRRSSPNKKKKGSKKSTQGGKGKGKNISQDKSYIPPTHKPKKKDNSSKQLSNTRRNIMSDALKASKTSSDVAKTLLLKSDQESTTEGKRHTKKLLREALSVSKMNAEVAASLCRQSNVALKTKESKLVLKEFEDCSTDDSTDASSSNESQEVVPSCHTGQRVDKQVMMISSKISKKCPRIPETQIKELVAEALIIAEGYNNNEITKDNKVKKTREEENGDASNFRDILRVMKSSKSKKEASNFRDILRVMKSSKSKKEEDCDDKCDDVLSLLSIDSSQSCSRLRELMKDGRTAEESVEYLLSNTQQCVENVVQTAVKEGKTPQEIREILLKLEEERVIALEKREEKIAKRKSKHQARQLVAEAVAAGAGRTPSEIAEFIMKREAQKTTKELVEKAITKDNKVKKTREEENGDASNFRDILRVMKSSKSKKEEDCDDKCDDVLSLLSIDSSQSCSRLMELTKDGRTAEESVEYLLSNTQQCVENVVQTAVKEGKTPQEIGEILLKLEEERVIALEKREEKIAKRKSKHQARQLVAEAVAAGAGRTPSEIAEFIMKIEAQKTTKELVEKAMKECKTPEEIAAYLLKASETQGTQNDLAEERSGANEESSWSQKMISFVKKVSQPSPSSKPPSTPPSQSFALLDACSVEESADKADVCVSLKNGIQICVDDNAELLNDVEDTTDYILNVGVDGAEMCASVPDDDGSRSTTTLNDIIRLASF